jgi:serum response factor
LGRFDPEKEVNIRDFGPLSRQQMQTNGLMNGHRTMNLQFVNETESVISESLGNDYGNFNLKRGLDSDSDSDGSKMMGYDPNGDNPMPVKQGKKTKGRVKIKMEFIENKLRRYTTFSKRKTGIMKKVWLINLFLIIINL